MGEWFLFSILSIHFILSGQTYKRVLSCKNIFFWDFVRCPMRKAMVWKTTSDAISAQLEYTPGPRDWVLYLSYRSEIWQHLQRFFVLLGLQYVKWKHFLSTGTTQTLEFIVFAWPDITVQDLRSWMRNPNIRCSARFLVIPCGILNDVIW